MGDIFKRPAVLLFFFCSLAAFLVGRYVPPTWATEKILLDMHQEEDGSLYYYYKEKKVHLDPKRFVSSEKAHLNDQRVDQYNREGIRPQVEEEYVYEKEWRQGTEETSYYLMKIQSHFKFWSLLPALVALGLCWINKEPITSLLGGIIVGAFLLGRYDITEDVLVEELSAKSAAGILVLYLWLLGGLMGIWSKTGAAKAFADLMTKHFVRGPKTAKLVAWLLGVVFFQGGTVSTVLVGTTVKPIADKNKISHEELSYIVDSTASPIASQIAFNAWPGYVQAFIFVGGVSWLATEQDRVTFFFKSVPFCFYAIFAVLGTFLMSIDKAPFLGRRMRKAIHRARTTGQLDAPGANPLSAKELQATSVPEGYQANVWEFFLPLALLIAVAIGTFIHTGTPNVRWAFAGALLLALGIALLKGMSIKDAVDGISNGLKGVVTGSVILLLAVIIGEISKDAGGGLYIVEQLKGSLPYWSLPVLLELITIVIAFSTGTSWGTYAITFPLAMPLSWAIANTQGLENPEFFMMICFAAVMDGSVYGDQCSPISDTTVLSSMCCGCDLMDHVKSQIPPATAAATLAAIAWTGCVLLFA